MESDCEMCGGNIAIPEDVIEGEIVSCPDCGLDFEINTQSSGTIILRPAEEIKEDWGE